MNFIRPNLAVSGFDGVRARERFLSLGFDAQLQCAEGFDRWVAECVEVKALPFVDGAPIPAQTFAQSQAWLGGHWDLGHKILISCAAGMSRSVAMTAALLALKANVRFVDAIAEVMAKRPEANPHPMVLASAAAMCGQRLALTDLREVYALPPLPIRISWPERLLREAIQETQHLVGPER